NDAEDRQIEHERDDAILRQDVLECLAHVSAPARAADHGVTPLGATPASALTSSAAHCGPRYEFGESTYHSPSACAPPPWPPPPIRIAGMPMLIGMFASVLDALVCELKPSDFAALRAVCTIGAASAWPPVGRMPIVSMVMVSFAFAARGPGQRAF